MGRPDLSGPGRSALRGTFGLAHAAVSDRVPFPVEFLDGEVQTSGSLQGEQPLVLRYRVRPQAPGRVRFEGLRLRTADLQGFFYRDTFLCAVVQYRVLPVLADARGQPATTKRHNLLPPPGIHHLRRAGSGSELLDLRDYRPGDPPRTIAWKVSARRDRLITKEFESEVPLRCTLFLDTSNSVRVGPPGQKALTRLTAIAAAVAQANTGNRDLTGLCLFDDRTETVVMPARTPDHLIRLLKMLADAADLAPMGGEVRVSTLLPLAYSFAQEVYPDWLRPVLNHVPFWLAWLAPRPAWTIRRPTLAERLYGHFPLWILFLLFFSGLGVIFLVAAILGGENPESGLPFGWLLALVLGGGFGLLLLFQRVPLLLPRQRTLEVWRKRLAALLSVRHGLAPGGLAALMEDDDLMVSHLQRFLAEHQVPCPLSLYDHLGRYQFAAAGKVDVLARALLRAVGRGHDNELFVLLVDLLELSERVGPLLRRAGRVGPPSSGRGRLSLAAGVTAPWDGRGRNSFSPQGATWEKRSRTDSVRHHPSAFPPGLPRDAADLCPAGCPGHVCRQ